MARFLDVNKGERQPSVTQEDVDNKMLEGTRTDQGGRPRARTANKVIRLAADLGVDLAHVDGTGDDNQITEEDVRKAADDPAKRVPDAAVITDTRAGTVRRAGQTTTTPQDTRTTRNPPATSGAPGSNNPSPQKPGSNETPKPNT